MRFKSVKFSDAKDYFLTAFLLITALLLLVNRNQGGMKNIRTISVTALSVLEEPLANIRRYRQALNTNVYLQRQNVLLQDELSRLRALEQENKELRRLLNYQEQSAYPLSPALVVGKQLSGMNNFMTIDAGTNDSVQTGMPFVTSDGLVGRVVITSSGYSQVMPFYNPLFRVSSRIQENQAVGIVSWKSDLFGELIMEYVPSTISVDSGYTVESSGFGNEFPAGIPIGRVIRTEPQEGKETQIIYLVPFVSLSEIAEGFVIRFTPDSARTEIQNESNRLFE